jgi:putative tricarboxylic transport membrane protein
VSDRIFAVLWIGVCVVILYQMWALAVPFAYEPVGPKAFPMLMAFLMAACCVVLVIKPDADVHWPEASLLIKGALLVAVLLGYASLFAWLGFPLATVAMALMVSRLFGGSWLSSAVMAVIIGLLGYLVFDRLLEVSLPLGLTRLES